MCTNSTLLNSSKMQRGCDWRIELERASAETAAEEGKHRREEEQQREMERREAKKREGGGGGGVSPAYR